MADKPVSNSDERRSEERTSARIQVRFAKADDAAKALRAYSLNLSAGGLCLKTQRTYEVGTQLSLTIAVAGQQFNLTAAVSWARAGAIGVRFENLSSADRMRLQTLAASLRRAS
jgi:uncharacterized protein (TIGR02266 family)